MTYCEGVCKGTKGPHFRTNVNQFLQPFQTEAEIIWIQILSLLSPTAAGQWGGGGGVGVSKVPILRRIVVRFFSPREKYRIWVGNPETLILDRLEQQL